MALMGRETVDKQAWCVAAGVGLAALVIGTGIGFFLERPGDSHGRSVAAEEPRLAPYAILGREIGKSEEDTFRLCANISGVIRTRRIDFSAEEVCFEMLSGLDCQRRHAGRRAFNTGEFLNLLVKLIDDGLTRYDVRERLCKAIGDGL